jgi:predicted amidohydrolase
MDLTVVAFQSRAIYRDIKQGVNIIKKTIQWAENENVDILCFPECFLQGYILDEMEARQAGLQLDSEEFKNILKSLRNYKTTVILGLIEQESGKIYNTAAVIEKGKLVGKYRKQHLLKKESFFKKGISSPVFEKKKVKYGINICYDTRFSESIRKMAKMGAQIIFCPLNNSLPHKIADKWRNRHLLYWIARAKEASCWIITADVIEKSDTNTGFGFTTLIDPNGKVIEYLEQLKPGMLKYQIKF